MPVELPGNIVAPPGQDVVAHSVTVKSSGPYTSSAAAGEVVTAVNPYNVKVGGTVGNGVADDTVAVRVQATAAAASAVTDPAGIFSKVGRGVLELPPGAFLITDTDALVIAPTGAGVLADGYTVRGAGRGLTQIIFTPSSAKNLINNGDGASRGWKNLVFEDLTFVGGNTNATFMSSVGPGIAAVSFHRVNWEGTWANGVNLTGTNNNSEWTFDRCEITGTWTTFFNSTGADQFVNFWWRGCSVLLTAGNFMVMTKGGHVSIFGGSLITLAGSNTTLFRLMGTTHSLGACYFLAEGVRVELRDTGGKLMYCEWPKGSVTWIDVDGSTQSSIGGASTMMTETYNPGAGEGGAAGPTVTHINCDIMGQHEFQYSSSGAQFDSRIIYDNCQFMNWPTPAGAIIQTAIAGTTQIGVPPVVHFEHCRGTNSANTLETGSSDFYWHLNKRGETKRRVVSIKTAFGVTPISGASETVDLPLNCVITYARLYREATGSGLNTTATLTLQTTEGSPTVLLTVPSTPNQLKNGFDYSAEPMFRCTSDAKRILTVVSNAANNVPADCLLLVEYIG